jgi:PAS domain S-box-containing protein
MKFGFNKVMPAPNVVSSKNLAASLRDERLKSNIILNAIEDGVVLVDGQGIIQLFNPGAATITGWSSEEAVGLDWRSVFKFVDTKGQPIDESATSLKKAIASGENVHDNAANLVTKSGKSIALNLGVSPLLDDTNHTVTGAVGIFRDVSQERAEQNQRAEFISTASHEMRTPVAAIEGYLSLALNDKVATIDHKARDYLEKAHASTKHLGQLFQDLLTSAKAEDGRLTNHPKVVEMGGYLEQLVQDLKFSAEKKGLYMEFTFGAAAETVDTTHNVVRPLYYVQVDPDRLREVITNLFDNAVKYTDQGRINIGLTGNDKVVQFYIRDTGPGIPADDIPHLFQKFYRVDNSATRTIGGTGLGLFICRKIVELYQGRIWTESEVGKGTTFFINLPRLSTQRAEEMQVAESKESQLAPISTATGL